MCCQSSKTHDYIFNLRNQISQVPGDLELQYHPVTILVQTIMVSSAAGLTISSQSGFYLPLKCLECLRGWGIRLLSFLLQLLLRAPRLLRWSVTRAVGRTLLLWAHESCWWCFVPSRWPSGTALWGRARGGSSPSPAQGRTRTLSAAKQTACALSVARLSRCSEPPAAQKEVTTSLPPICLFPAFSWSYWKIKAKQYCLTTTVQSSYWTGAQRTTWVHLYSLCNQPNSERPFALMRTSIHV